MQKQDATRVAGFKAWLALGYCVRRGEKALRIFAPCPPSKAKLEAWRQAGADPAEKPRTFFRLTAVFDRSQVQELPPPAEPAPLDPPTAAEIDGDELAPWLEPLTALAAEIGSTVSFEPIASGADGHYRPKTKAIVVEAAHPANRQVKTLVHELSHALVRADRQDDDPSSTRPPRSSLPRRPFSAPVDDDAAQLLRSAWVTHVTDDGHPRDEQVAGEVGCKRLSSASGQAASRAVGSPESGRHACCARGR